LSGVRGPFAQVRACIVRALLEEAGDLGARVDPEVAEVVHVGEQRLFEAGTNAARMLHEDGMSPAEAEAYLQEWSLDCAERAAKTVAFLMDARLRTYTTAYTDARRL
jgi:hypothetical protein